MSEAEKKLLGLVRERLLPRGRLHSVQRRQSAYSLDAEALFLSSEGAAAIGETL